MDMQTKTVHIVDSAEFDRVVSEFFHQEYNFQAEEEAGNDTEHMFTADPKSTDDEYFMNRLVEWLEGKSHYAPGPGYILSVLAYNGKIPAGDYVIRVSY